MENKDLTSLIGKTIKHVMWVPPKPVDEFNLITGPAQFTEVYIEFTDNLGAMFKVIGYGLPDVPEGYNGPGMYETRTKAFEMNHLDGHKNVLTLDGERTHPEFETVRFYADSLEHAKSRLNLDEVKHVKWVSAWPTTNNE